MKLTITQQDIDKANKLCAVKSTSVCECCPTAIAIKRQNLVKRPFVGYNLVHDSFRKNRFELSEELTEQIRSFTHTRRFKLGDYEITQIS